MGLLDELLSQHRKEAATRVLHRLRRDVQVEETPRRRRRTSPRQLMGLLVHRSNERRHLGRRIEGLDNQIEGIRKKLRKLGQPAEFI
jgi:hypothetical protein